jgi:Uma2 family endonuclease
MSTTTRLTVPAEIEYPDSDGEPMAENTVQYDWITTIKGGLDVVFRDDPDVFVAADLFWYPVEGSNTIRRAPDTLVAFGRPKGPRRSYMQWREGGIAPQVVFEILSPSNRGEELALKFQFYETYGVEEYYIYDPEYSTFEGWLRDGQTLRRISALNGWVSPRLDVRFEWTDDQLRLYSPNGQPFVSVIEYAQEAEEQRHNAEEQRQQAEEQRQQAEEQRQQTEEQRQKAEEQRQRAERLAAQLRSLGIEPEDG